jgi:RNA polymerase sigma-32 factor
MTKITDPELLSFCSEQIARTELAERKLAEKKPGKRQNRHKMLSAKEELALFERLRNGDTKAEEELVLAHMPLIGRIAADHRLYNLPEDELRQEGSIALLESIRLFDPQQHKRLSAFAWLRIKGAVRRYIEYNFSHVKIGTSDKRRRIFWNLPKTLRGIDRSLKRSQRLLIAAKRLKAPVRDVFEIAGQMYGDISLQTPIGADDMELGDLFQAEPPTDHDDDTAGTLAMLDEGWFYANPFQKLARKQEVILARDTVADVLGVLNNREREIFVSRYLTQKAAEGCLPGPDDTPTLKALGERFDMTAQGVAYVENKAHEKVTEALRSRIGQIDFSAYRPFET